IRDEFAEDLSALLQSFVARDCERRKQCSRKDDPSFDVRHDRMTRAASPSARQIHNAPWSSLLRDAVRPARSNAIAPRTSIHRPGKEHRKVTDERQAKSLPGRI